MENGSYDYNVSDFLIVSSEFKSFLLDSPEKTGKRNGDIVIIEDSSQDQPYRYHWDRDQFIISVKPSFRWSTSKSKDYGICSSSEFTELLLSSIEYQLLERGATIAFAGAVRSPDGDQIVLFGEGNSGKSTTIFELVNNFDYELLADDLVIFHQGLVYPFPRFFDLPLDVPWIEDEIGEFAMECPSAVYSWGEASHPLGEEVSIPRRECSKVVNKMEPDYSFFLPRKRGWVKRVLRGETQFLSPNQLWSRAKTPNKNHAQDWTTHSGIKRQFTTLDDRWRIIEEAIKTTECYEVCCQIDETARTISNTVSLQ